MNENKLPPSLRHKLSDDEISDILSSITVKGNGNKTDIETNTITLEDVMLEFIGIVGNYYINSVMLKGCLALKQHITNMQIRNTQDIDITIKAFDEWEDLVKNATRLATDKSKLGFSYKVIARRGYNEEFKSDSIKINAINGDLSFDFKLDMNIKTEEKFLECDGDIAGNSILIYALEGIIADKVKVLATKTICRRIKDLLDIYVIAKTHNYRLLDLLSCVIKRYPQMRNTEAPIFILQEANYPLLKHAYEKYKTGSYVKPDFNEVLVLVQRFTSEIYLKLKVGIGLHDNIEWRCDDGKWLLL